MVIHLTTLNSTPSCSMIFCGYSIKADNLHCAAMYDTTVNYIAGDCNPKDKQRYPAVLRLCSIDKEGNGLPDDMVENLWVNEDFRGDAMYWRFVRKFICITISSASVDEKLAMVRLAVP